MNAGQLYDDVKGAFLYDKPERIYKSLRDYAISHCHNPQTVKVFNSVLGIYELRQVPCGYCKHCLNTKSNEWVTRMTAHLEDFKYCYFVTLSYRSFDADILSKRNSSKFVLFDYLKDALFICDSNNINHHYSYNPCVLVKKHYQNFLKRLRLLVSSPISFVCSGEYGHRFGRPHMHLILYCNEPITLQQIKEAWSLKVCFHNGVWKQKTSQKTSKVSHLLIGHVDYHDLVLNGTIGDHDKNTIPVDGQNLSLKQCFAYVSKYLHKNEYNDSRVRLSFNLLDKIYKATEFDFTDYAKSCLTNNYITYLHETYKIYFEGLSVFQEDSFGQLFRIYPDNISDYLRCFKPFHECSRGTAIGSLFIRRNLQKYIEGVKIKPSFQKAGFVCPSYFIRKVNEYFYGLRSTSHTPSHNSTLGNLAVMFHNWNTMGEDEILRIYGFNTASYHGDIQLLNSRYAFKDLSTGTRYLILYDSVSTPVVLGYKYNRKIKQYEEIKRLSLSQFIAYWTKKFVQFKGRYLSLYEQSKLNVQLYYDVKDLCNEFLHGTTSSLTPFEDVMFNIYSLLESDYKYQQNLYNLNHINDL